MIDSFSNKISEMVSDILSRRNQIKEDFFKAYLSATMPDDADLDWIIQNIELVEQRTSDALCVKWYFREKTPTMSSEDGDESNNF